MKRSLTFALAFTFVATFAHAQTATVINPTQISFTASADHNVVLSGVPVLDHYDVNVVVGNSSGALSFTKSIGKPVPDAQNTISVTLPEFVALNRGTYVATVSSVAPGINPPTSISTATDPFVSTGKPAAVPKPTAR